jgi:ABC-2 type transport system ATP-binding protein
MNGKRGVIEVSGVSKTYPIGFWRKRVRVLYDLSLTVGENEIVGFLGPNGAGKTTTIKILNGLAFPDSGTVTIFGEAAGRRSESRRRIGFMPEQPYFYEYLTGGEFLCLCGHLNGLARRETRKRSQEMLARVGLATAAGLAIRKYSKGMMQRLGLAQALLHDPELVILDEPMSGLDPMGRVEVRNLIRELKEAGKTVFFSSHIISDVEALCDRVVMIHRGVKIAEGSVEELMGKEGIQYVEVVFSPPPPPGWASVSGLPRDSGSVRGDTFVLKARDPSDANHWIGELRKVGSLVNSCIPVKKHLEEIYVERIGGNAKEAGRG